jgi:hypothetical protein
MAWYDKWAMYLVSVLVMLGPAILLVWLRGRTRQWWIAIPVTLLMAPVVAFLLTGGIAYLMTYIRVVIQGDTSVPDEYGWTVPQYLGMTFGKCGIYGVLFAGLGAMFWVPALVLWRIIHSRSFRFVTDRPVSSRDAPD